MGTNYIDPEQFVNEYLGGIDMTALGAAQGKLRHVHLQVGDIGSARQFYVDAPGFDETFAMKSALFVSAGGYHHHTAMNAWHSAGAR